MESDVAGTSQIRLLIAGPTTGMLRDILARVVGTGDGIRVVGNGETGEDLVGSVRRHAANVVLLGIDDSELPAACRDLFKQCADVIVVGIAADGRRASVFANDLSPTRLMETIRLFRRSQ